MATENHNNPHPGSIPVDLAVEFTTNWRTYLSSANSDFVLQSFWVNIESIKSLLHHNPNADGLRFYMGLENPADPTSVKIVCIPTENNNDILDPVDQLTPCPPYCPTGGPLNG